MKYLLTFFAALFVVGVSAVPLNGNRTDLFNSNRSDILINTFLDIFNGNESESNPLDIDIIDFVKLIPIDKLREAVKKYQNDTKIMHTVEYLHSKEFHKLVYAMEALPEYHRYVFYLQESGYNKIRELRMIHKILGMKDYVPPKPSHQVFEKNDDSEGGFNGLIKEYIAILPVKEIKELHQKKLKESPAFAKFVSYMHHEKWFQILKSLNEKTPVKNILNKTKEHYLDLLAVIDLKLRIVGFRP